MRVAPRGQRGLTLVEMLVSLVIGLVVSLAALALYLAMNDSSRAGRAAGDANESARLLLDRLGRDLQNAGFYPAQYPAGADPARASTVGEFFNGKAGRQKAFDSGVFGCEGAAYDPATKGCGPRVDGAPDSIVLNHFVEPAGSTPGAAHDCNHQSVTRDPDNAARLGAGMPLLVSNRYAVKANSLSCHGNGNESSPAYTAQLPAVDDMTIRYGLYSGATPAQSPDMFLNAAAVDREPTVDGLTPWQRVTAVKVCIVVRSQTAMRSDDKGGPVRMQDCRGADIRTDAAGRPTHKRFERAFAVRNNLTGTL